MFDVVKHCVWNLLSNPMPMGMDHGMERGDILKMVSGGASLSLGIRYLLICVRMDLSELDPLYAVSAILRSSGIALESGAKYSSLCSQR